MATRKLIELLIEEEGDAFGVEAISLVKFPAIESNWIAFSKEGRSKMLSLAAIDEDKRTLIGPALIPEKHIPRYDELSDEEYDVYFSKETVKLASELFLKTNRTNEHTFEHDTKVEGVSVVESWIVEEPEMDKSKHYGMSMPKGTWMVRVHVGNDEMWEAVKDGSVRGFSIEGYFLDSLQEMSTKVNKGSVKKTLSRIWNFLKRNFYAEVKLENGNVIATEDEKFTAGVEVFAIDSEGMPVEAKDGKFKTEAGVDLEIFEGVLIEYDGEVKKVEDTVEEPKVELDAMKVAYYKALLKGRIQTNLSINQKFYTFVKTNKTNKMKREFMTWEDYEYGSPSLDKLADALEREFGIRSVGSNFDFYGHIEGELANGLWIAAENYPEFFNYWSMSGEQISKELETFADRNNLWWEWQDAGTILLVED